MMLRQRKTEQNFTKTWKLMRVLLLITAVSLLTACATRGSSTLEIYCPEIIVYDDEFNSQLADELMSVSEADSEAINRAIIDYIKLRDTLRNCHIERDKINANTN